METTIELSGLNFSYGDIKAVDNVSLITKRGIYGLLGPNGAGKTTLMKLILGFLKARSGSGKVLGYDIGENRRELRRQIRTGRRTGRAYTNVVKPSDVEKHQEDFNDYYDRIRNPSQYAAPRYIKFGVGLLF